MASTVAGLLQEAAAEFPYREVVRDTEAEVLWSNAQLLENTTALANGLGELGVKAGDTIVTMLPNNTENLITTLAAAAIGARVVPTTPSTSGGLSSLLAQSNAKVVIYGEDADEVVAETVPDVVDEQMLRHDIGAVSNDRFPNLDFVISTNPELTENEVIPFKTILMHNAVVRCQVARGAKQTSDSTPVVDNSTNADILSAADKLVSKLGLTSTSQVTVSSSDPAAIAIAGAAALKTNSLLHLSGLDPASATNIDDAALA